jgi:hypothetical protein
MKIRMDNLTGHILRKNCLLKEVIEGKKEGRIEVTRRLGRRLSQLLLLLSSVGTATLVGFGMLNYLSMKVFTECRCQRHVKHPTWRTSD